METIKTALGFGSAESQEPVSGQTGAGTATDPYDAGNANQSGTEKEGLSDTLTGSKPQPDKDLVDGDRGVGLSHETTDAKNTFGQSISTPAGTRDEITKETISQSGQEPPSGYSGTGTAVDPYDGGNQPDQSGSSAEETVNKTVNDATSSKTKSPPSAVQTDTSTYPGLQGHPLLNAEPTPLPTPMADPMDQNTFGDSKPSTGPEPTSEELSDTEAQYQSEKPVRTVPDIGQQQVLPQLPQEDESEGTGTKYVESTGLVADGGDFDANRPGAGRDADRLLEEAGMKHGPGGGTAPTTTAVNHGGASTITADSDLADSTKHMKLTDKIKDKLHFKKKSSSG